MATNAVSVSEEVYRLVKDRQISIYQKYGVRVELMMIANLAIKKGIDQIDDFELMKR